MPECLRLTVPGAVGITGRLLWCWHVKQPARSRDVFRAPAIGEEAVVSNAVETVGQDVDQKAADELVDVECHQLVAVFGLGPVILPFERHALAVEGDEAAVGNSNAVRVAGQVGEHSVGSAKRPLGIDHPFDLSQCGKRSVIGTLHRMGAMG